MSQFLCLPKDVVLEFQGKYSSSNFKFIKISVNPCKMTVNDSTRTCISDAEVDSLIANMGGQLVFNYYYINTIINANNVDYLG